MATVPVRVIRRSFFSPDRYAAPHGTD